MPTKQPTKAELLKSNDSFCIISLSYNDLILPTKVASKILELLSSAEGANKNYSEGGYDVFPIKESLSFTLISEESYLKGKLRYILNPPKNDKD